MLQLHVWGLNDSIAIIDAESLAASWYLSLALPVEDFEIVTSSNVNLSSTGKLPTLIISDDEKYNGYLEIIRYLMSQGHGIDESLKDEARAINSGLLFYIQENLQKITDYTLFLNKDNFEKFSRGIFKYYLPFPMQYNTPIQFRSLAKEKCSSIGLTVEDKTEVEEEILKNIPTVSKVQKMKNESLIEEKLIIKNSVTNMKCLNILQKHLDVLSNLRKELKLKQNLLNDDHLSSSDLLFLAHIFILTNEALPDQFITTYLKKNSLELYNSSITQIEQIDQKFNLATVIPPTFSQSPNIVNAIKHLFV